MESGDHRTISDDARLYLRFVQSLRSTAIFSALTAPKPDIDVREAMDWWNKQSLSDESRSLIQTLLRANPQAISANIALYLPGSVQTLYLPVPFAIFDTDETAFFKAVWHGWPCQGLSLPPEARLRFALEYCHATTNVSYGIRVGDKPSLGLLAAAFDEERRLYIPDVMNIRGVRSVRSAVVASEAFLGMASVIYIPIVRPPSDDAMPWEKDIRKAGVIMIWSPVPGRWDNLYPPTLGGFTEPALTEPEASEILASLDWLTHEVSKEAKAQELVESQLILLLRSLGIFAQSLSPDLKTEFQTKYLHGNEAIIRAIETPGLELGETSAVPWLRDMLVRGNGFLEIMKQNYRKKMAATRIVIRDQSPDAEPREFEATGASIRQEIDAILKHLPAGAYIPLATPLINSFLFEVATNAPKYATEVTQIECELSRDYLSLTIHSCPKPETVDSLIGNKASFRQYYRVRRGLGLERAASPGYAIGLALQGLLGPRFNVYSRLRLAPDGANARHELAFPLKRRKLTDD